MPWARGGYYPPRSQLQGEIETESSVYPNVFRTSNPMELKRMMYDQTESGKSNMAASKLAVSVSQLVDEIGTKSQRPSPRFRSPAIQ